MSRHNWIRLKWAFAGMAAYFLTMPVSAQYFELKDPILEQNGIKYAITGVAESKDDARWKTAPLIVEFATQRAELYADVDVKIQDASQKQIFAVKVNAPWLVLWLQPGTYTVHATDKNGVSKSMTVNVTTAHQMKTFKW